MNRRHFLRSIGALSASAAAGMASPGWRTFEVTTRVEVLQSSGATRVWLPTPLIAETPFQKTLSTTFQAEGGTAELIRTTPDSLGILVARFPSGAKPVLTLTTRVATKDYLVELAAPTPTHKEDRTELDYFRRSTKLLPTDGIVKETAAGIVHGAVSDLEKARAIYDWIVDNTFRDPKTRGCGTGNIRFMLESRDLGGKCADLNALYVGLARAVGLPARDVYGIRIGPSALGYKSLGTSSEVITKSQHCRAEVYISGYGWVPVDPADVRKVVLEEPPGQMVTKARARLFGSWEMNWMAYNYAHDVALPGSGGAPVGFLMYPQAETQAGRIDSLDPDTFKYEIKSTPVAPARDLRR